MSWVVALAALAGLALAAVGTVAGTALIAVGRAELAQVVSRRLRGVGGPLVRLGRADELVAAAATATALGVVLLGVAFGTTLADGSGGGGGNRLIFSAASFTLLGGLLLGGYYAVRLAVPSRAPAIERWLAPVLRVWAVPVRWALPARGATRLDQLRTLWHEGAAVGATEGHDLSRVEGVIEFARRPSARVMTPRTEIIAVAHDADLATVRGVFAHSGYSRLPVYRGTLDDIIGMVHALDLLKLSPGGGAPLPVLPVALAPASRSCGDLLLDMQRERRHLAVMLDEFGGTLGIVTLEDLLEELVGEAFGESSPVTAATPPSGVGAARSGAGGGDILEIDGAAEPSLVAEHFSVVLPDSGAATVSGLLTHLAGRIPRQGERLLVAGLEFDVIRASPTRLERLLVRPGPVVAVSLTREDA